MKHAFGVCLALVIFPSLHAQPTATFREGAFAAEQAARGERVYAAKCASCHGDVLQGVEMAPALTGSGFTANWNRQPLLSLANRIRITMPPAAPRSLSTAEVTDLVSYLLRMNDVKPGGVALNLPLGGPAVRGGANTSWTTYGADLASTRYSPLDQINKDNFAQLRVAWRLKTNNLGPIPDRLYSATPLLVDGVMYTTAGSARSVVALNPGTGQMLWMYQLDEGERGQFAPRRGAGRGLSYWASVAGVDRRIIFVTPGYRMIALNAKTGHLIDSFGKNGIVDLKEDNDQKLDLVRANIGLNATPLVVGDLIVV
ncbi:MAG: c-type cytochrome, partial [Acidobacteria bacterium]|nr:c-type cytochrome [Acidobacteriota bacterium]